jgi:hypothetical protein
LFIVVYCHISIFSAISELPDFMGGENQNEYIELTDGTPTIGRCLEVYITDVRPVFRLVIRPSATIMPPISNGLYHTEAGEQI